MLHMKTESEVIQKLRYQVDYWDEQQDLQPDPEKLPKKMDSNIQQHVQLCSPDTNHTTISAYNVTLHREHGITNFLESLSLFLKRNNLEPDVYSYKVGLNLRHLLLCANKTDYTLSLMSSHL